MRVFAKALLCGVLPLSLLLGGFPVAAYTGNSSQNLTSGADIRVMSFNTLVDNDEENGGWSWGQALGSRGDKAAAMIKHYKPDVIGLQENNYNWHVSLRANLPDYDYVNADVPEVQKLEKTESLGKKDWMCTTMMYNTKTLELVYNELIGYSVNYWGCIQRMRYLSMAIFKVKATGEMFVFTSTHFDAESDTKGQRMRDRQATEMMNLLNGYKSTYGLPIISTGDFNSGYNDAPITKLRENVDMDSYKDNRGGIDYILYSQGVSCKYFTVVNDTEANGASDHKPIFADVALQDNFSFPTTGTTQSTTTTTTTKKPTTTTTLPSAFKPTRTTAGNTTTTAKKTDATVADPTTTQATAAPSQGTDAPVVNTTETPIVDVTTTAPVADPTDAPVVDTPTDPVESTPPTEAPTTPATDPVIEDEGEQADAKAEKKDNTLLYVGIAAAVVAIGAVIAVVLLRKKK